MKKINSSLILFVFSLLLTFLFSSNLIIPLYLFGTAHPVLADSCATQGQSCPAGTSAVGDCEVPEFNCGNEGCVPERQGCANGSPVGSCPTLTGTLCGTNPNSGGGSIETPFGTFTGGAADFATKFLTAAIGIAGGVAFLLMAFGAYRLIFSAGNPEAVQQGRDTITAAIVGLLIIVFSVFILHLIGITILQLPGLSP